MKAGTLLSGKRNENWSLFLKMLRMARPYWGWYTLLMLVILVSSLFAIGIGEGTRRLINAATYRDSRELQLGLLIMGSAFLAEVAGDYSKGYLQRKLANLSVLNLQRSSLQKLLAMPLATFEKWHTGDKLQRLNDSAVKAQEGINTRIPQLLGFVLQIIFLLGYLSFFSLYLVVVVIIVALLMPLATNLLGRLVRKHQRAWNEQQAMQEAELQDQLQNPEVTRVYGMQKRFLDQWRGRLAASRISRLRLWRSQYLMFNLQEFSFWVGMLVIMGVGFWGYSQGNIELGTLAAFIFSYERIAFPLAGIAGMWGAVQDSFAHGHRLFEMVDAGQEEKSSAFNATEPNLALEFAQARNLSLMMENLTFSYANGPPVIDGLNLTIEAGQTTALVGPSGGGKSTLIKLLLGLYDLDSGTIRYGSYRIDHSNRATWLRKLAYVPQDTSLFPVSIQENLRYGWLEADDQMIEQAAKLAGADAFIRKLPEGYQTVLGEKGTRLSGGERQRVVIARALVRNPEILLMDEPTSALDTMHDDQVTEAVARSMQGRTVIIIAHRKQTIRHADQIIYIDDGQVKEQGSHHELMQRQGLYADWYNREEVNAQPQAEPEGGDLV